MAQKKKQNGRLFVIIIVIATVVFVPITFYILAAYGEKSGVEFSPDDFTMRSFDYCKLPFFNLTRRGIKYYDYPSVNANLLIDDDWIRVTGRTPKRWHLVSENQNYMSTGRYTSADCDARFLTRYFDLSNDDGDNYIMKWTKDNPKSAKVFWPLIAEMARGNLYLPIPELMEFTLDYQDPDKDDSFASELEKRVGEAWYQAGLTDQLRGLHKRAIERFETASSKGDGHTLAQQAKLESEAASP